MNGRTNANLTTNDTLQVPLDPPTLFMAEGFHEKISLTWTDPKTKYATPEGETAEDPDQVVATWDHTVIVRKTDGYPATPDDGIVVISSGQYNQYQSSPYVDTGLTNQTQYYYAAFAFNSDGIPSEPAHVECFLYGYDEVFANNSWEYIDRACSEGLHTSLWEIGDSKPVTVNFSTGAETFNMDIIDFNHDDLADGSGKACITLCSHEQTTAKFIRANYRIPDYYTESELFDEINAIYNIFDETSETFKKYIRYVYKNEAPRTSNGSYWDPVQFQCYLFALGVSEITTDTLSTIYPVQESGEGVLYPYYATSSNRTKLKSDGTEFTGDELMAGKGYWGLRMIHHETNSIGQNANAYYGVFWNSGSISDNATYINLVFAFCIGKSTV